MMNWKYFLLIVLLVCFIAPATMAQEDDFLAHSLGDSVNTFYPEINPVLSPGGQTLYYSVINHPHNHSHEFNGHDVWFAEKSEDGKWGHGRRMPDAVNLGNYNVVYAVVDEGKTLLIEGVYTKKGIWYKRGFSYVSVDEYGNWTKPIELKIPGYSDMNQGYFTSAFLNIDKNLLIISFSKHSSKENNDLYVCELQENNKWSRPKFLSKNINSRDEEITPFLSADKKTLFFASNRSDVKDHNGLNYKIYKSERLNTDSYLEWSDPEVFFDTNGVKMWEAFFRTNQKGDYAYFTQNSDSVHSSDVYEQHLFENDPSLVLRGSVMNKYRNHVVDDNHDFNIIVSKVWDENAITTQLKKATNDNHKTILDKEIFTSTIADYELIIDTIKKTYRLELPLGEVYEVAAVTNGYVSDVFVVNAQAKFHMEVNHHLYVEPLSYIRVKGKIDIDQPLDFEYTPALLLVDDLIDENAMIYANGDFEVLLSAGYSYKLSLRVDGYVCLPELLSLEFSTDSVIDELHLKLEKKESHEANIHVKVTNDSVIYNGVYYIKIDGEYINDDLINNHGKSHTLLHLPINNDYHIDVETPEFLSFPQIVHLEEIHDHQDLTLEYKLLPLFAGQKVILDDLDFDIARLLHESHWQLDKLVDVLTEHGSIWIELEGFTDETGDPKLNKVLSKDMAKSVKEYLVKKGVSETRIHVRGFGSKSPIADNTTDEGHLKNRRVEVLILRD